MGRNFNRCGVFKLREEIEFDLGKGVEEKYFSKWWYFLRFFKVLCFRNFNF